MSFFVLVFHLHETNRQGIVLNRSDFCYVSSRCWAGSRCSGHLLSAPIESSSVLPVLRRKMYMKKGVRVSLGFGFVLALTAVIGLCAVGAFGQAIDGAI